MWRGSIGLIIGNATFASLSPRWIRTGFLLVDDGVIVSITDLRPDGEHEYMDADGAVIMPGLVCAHTHLYSALARGMPAPSRQPKNFLDILELIWWRLDRALDEPSIRSSALIGSIDALKSGTTTLVDHHASPNCIEGSLDMMAEEMSRVGVRGILCYEVTDRNGAEGRDQGLAENERFARSGPEAWPLTRPLFGAHAAFTLEDESLDRIAGKADDLGIGVHIHVAEDAADQSDSVRRSGKRVTARLDDHDIVNSKALLAHGVHLDEGEIDLIAQKRSWLAHNCRSNLNNSVGRAPVSQFLRKAAGRVALGTDGIDQDMFAESRSAYFRLREDTIDAYAEQAMDMLATGAELASDCFGRPVGKLEPGYLADLVVYDYTPPTPLTSENFAWHWAFAFSPALVKHVMVEGRWVLRDRSLVNLDGGEARAVAREQAKGLWERMQELRD